MRYLVRKLDDLIRRSNHVFEFNEDENCILRVQIAPAPTMLQLPNLTISPGDQALLLHIWNERLLPFTGSGADMAWAKRFQRQLKYSFCLAADYLHNNPHLISVCAVGGATVLLTSGHHRSGQRFIQDLGFTVFPYHSELGRFGEFWENFYSWLIIWTFNPGGLPDRSILSLNRSEMWMSKEEFLQRFRHRL